MDITAGDTPETTATDRTSRSGFAGLIVNFLFRVGVFGLAVGLLAFLAARMVGGGWAGIVLLSLVSWPLFEAAWATLRGLAHAERRVGPQHPIVGGCLGLILLCGGGGFLVCFGSQVIIGLLAGAALTVVNQRNSYVDFPQLLGLAPTPSSVSRPLDQTSRALLPFAKIGAGLIALAVGLVFLGFGTYRYLEANSIYTDYGCTHPCALVHGLWVQVVPDPGGNEVTRVDPSTVRLSLRFWDDAPGDKTIRPSDFTLKTSETSYQRVVGSAACDAWTPRTIAIDGNVSGLTLCFTVPAAVDSSRLMLDWTPPGGTAEIWLGQVHESGSTFVSAG